MYGWSKINGSETITGIKVTNITMDTYTYKIVFTRSTSLPSDFHFLKKKKQYIVSSTIISMRYLI